MPPTSQPTQSATFLRPAFVLSLILAVIGTIGFILFADRSAGFIAAHVGGLGILGVLACINGFIARRKGLNMGMAFAVALVIPAIIGAVAAVSANTKDAEGAAHICGAPRALAAAVLIIVLYFLTGLRNRKHPSRVGGS